MRQRPYRKKRPTGCGIIMLFCVLIALWGGYQLSAGHTQPAATADHSAAYEGMPGIPVKDPQDYKATPGILAGSSSGYQVAPDLWIHSSNAILVDLDDGKILLDRDSTARIYPASMTKMMTAIVALEHLKDLNKGVLLRGEMYTDIYAANAATAGFLPNEEVPAIDLLYGLLLPSGAECAIGLAEYVAGSESAFVDLMNDKARELGMGGTHFVNTTGLHDAEHYSTVKDISVLLEYALQNDTFYEIFTAARHVSRPTNLHGRGITYYSTLFSNLASADFDGGSILGGKTGYTDEAHQCLASLAEKNGRRYILVTCGAQGDRKTQNLHIDDAIAVYAAISAID